jgi:hypothetical protein
MNVFYIVATLGPPQIPPFLTCLETVLEIIFQQSFQVFCDFGFLEVVQSETLSRRIAWVTKGHIGDIHVSGDYTGCSNH